MVVSSQPGSKLGIARQRRKRGPGHVAHRRRQARLGRIGRRRRHRPRRGPGSGFSGPGSGAGKEGTGPGSDPMATRRNFALSRPRRRRHGHQRHSRHARRFGKGRQQQHRDLAQLRIGCEACGQPGRSNTNPGNHGPDITVVASSRSGGAFNFYGALKGDKVYTIYITTTLGTAVMQFADPSSAGHGYAEDLTAPQAMRSELPAGLPKARLVIACVLDRTGSAPPASSARTRHGSHDQQSPDRAQQLEVPSRAARK